MCVLEATETPLAKRLLAAAQETPAAPQAPPPQAAAPEPTVPGQLGHDDFNALLGELRLYAFDHERVKALLEWSRRQFKLTPKQRIRVLELFAFDHERVNAMRVLDREGA
jgi:hypothetical protein